MNNQQILNTYKIKDERTLRLCIIRWGQSNGKCRSSEKTKKAKPPRKESDAEILCIDVPVTEVKKLQDQFGKSKLVESLIMDIRMAVWKYSKLPCVIHFNNPTTDGSKLLIEGYCPIRRCAAMVIFETIDDGQKIRISWTPANQSVEHRDKAKVTGEMKNRILDMLDKDSPIVVHSKLINEYMEERDKNCPIIPNLSNLYQINYRAKKQSSLDDDSIRSIVQMRGIPEYYNCIHEVNYYPFSYFYATPLQQNFMQIESKKRCSLISIDATGISVTLPPEYEISTVTCFTTLFALGLTAIK